MGASVDWGSSSEASKECEVLYPSNAYPAFGSLGIPMVWEHQVLFLGSAVLWYCDRARGTGSHSNPFEFDSSPLASGTDMTSRASIQRLVQLGMGSISAHFGTCHRC